MPPSPSSSDPKNNLNLVLFEESLRRQVARQKKYFLLYETVLGFSLIVFLASFVNCGLNLIMCSSGVAPYLNFPRFMHETSSPPVSSFLSFSSGRTNIEGGFDRSSEKQFSSVKNNINDDQNEDDENSNTNLVAADNGEKEVQKDQMKMALNKEVGDDEDENKAQMINNDIDQESSDDEEGNSKTTTTPLPSFCFNQPLNFFWIFGLRPDLICFFSLIGSFALFVVVRGVFALRKPSRYIRGLNSALGREYGWRFDEQVGKLIVLPK